MEPNKKPDKTRTFFTK